MKMLIIPGLKIIVWRYYIAQDPYQYSVQSSPRLIPVREVPSDVYSSASDGSQESLTSETYSEFNGLSSLGQCQKT